MTTDWKALCAELVRIADALDGGNALVSNQGQALDGFSALASFRDVARRARAALAEPEPQPVPVSERLPGDELCWWYEPDEDDDPTGYGGNWTLLRIRGSVSFCTHWLPAHALPVPEVEA